MKKKTVGLLVLALAGVFLQGCIALPPLINVEHKDSASSNSDSNKEILKRLDTIDQRLSKLEDKSEKK